MFPIHVRGENPVTSPIEGLQTCALVTRIGHFQVFALCQPGFIKNWHSFQLRAPCSMIAMTLKWKLLKKVSAATSSLANVQ